MSSLEKRLERLEHKARVRRDRTTLLVCWFDLDGAFVREDRQTVPFHQHETVVFEVRYEGARVED
jgi:hypothetical protein